ncbi:MAG: ATPase [Lacticaseibacillus absianus]
MNHLPFNWVNLFELTAEISLIVFVFSLFIPYNAWGDWFAGLFHLKEGSLAFKLVQGIIPSVVLNSANTFICTAASIFYNEAIPKAARVSAYLDGCKKAWLPCFVVSYIASFAAVWLGSKVAEKYAK